MKRLNKRLMEWKTLPRNLVKEYNALWHAINDGTSYTDEKNLLDDDTLLMDNFNIVDKESALEEANLTEAPGTTYNFNGLTDMQKREAFDSVYDEVTEKVLGKAIANKEGVKKVFRKLWLNQGFEAADGNDEDLSAVLTIVERASNNSSMPLSRVATFMADNYYRLSPEIQRLFEGVGNSQVYTVDDNPAEWLITESLIRHPELYEYQDKEIVEALNSAYETITSKLESGEIQSFDEIRDFYLDGDKLTNIRSWKKLSKNRKRTKQDLLDTFKDRTISDKDKQAYLARALQEIGINISDKEDLKVLKAIIDKM